VDPGSHKAHVATFIAMNFTQIKETCLYVADLERTEGFYSGKLELPCFAKSPGRHVFFRAGSSVLLCFNAEATRADKELPPHYASGKQHLAFEVPGPAYEATKIELEGKGILITHEHTWPSGMRSFYFEDPDGHVLEIVPAGLWG
jgi:catechol 2,3-dioxygenase-like lactoylglutathione lyase family enzyme